MGSITKLTLPGGGELGLYQPSHPIAFKRTAAPAKRTEPQPMIYLQELRIHRTT